MTNPTLESLAARKSVRIFTDVPVTAAEKAAILQAAFDAPTAGCQQLYTILDITDPVKKRALAALCDHQDFIADAPLVFVFTADCARWPAIYRAAGISPREAGAGDLLLAAADACIAAQNTVVAAESLGLASCYIGDVLEQCDAMRALLHLPAQVLPAAMLIYGHPTAQQAARRKPARFAPEAVVCENEYRARPAEDWQRLCAERAQRGGEVRYDFAADTAAFCRRKYESAFSAEMTRSVLAYLADFPYKP